MTPEQIDTVTNGLIKTWELVGEYGPGLFAAAVAGGCWVAATRLAPRLRARREARRARTARRRQLLREVEQMARLARDIENAPLIPTQHGQDDQLLDACWDAWTADTRKESQ
ncbi:hypothetical protein [Streptomyces chartreusis]|uniref:hypothetical protein n=1 Tax=Streptomyces chartreusis TaxID=1969 RepID=UPI00123CC76F|nr:hypothetical protein [Streptomyces chartreusis]QEV66265.1 hypothetical protein CP983_06015 [Streptomyces chartreusis]GGW99086.1 hypothetical protein GCM10010321_11950 [Streptomyces chartreusis]